MNTLFRKLFAFVSLLRYIHAEITTFRCSSFDYSSNQDSATVSYATCNIFACPGKMLRLVHCGWIIMVNKFVRCHR